MADVAIITGALGGIGRELERAFLDKGYKVLSLDIKFEENPICEGKKSGAKRFVIDISNEVQVAEFFSSIDRANVLVNNAGIGYGYEKLTEVSLDKIRKVLDTNIIGSMLMSKYFIEKNAGEEYGRIINISSTRFHQNEGDYDAYGVSKGGIISLTNSLCVSLSGSKITANAISPGWIECENYDGLSLSDHSQHPSGRVGKPKDIANAVLFLADRENDFVNGANLIVDGGMTKRMIYV